MPRIPILINVRDRVTWPRRMAERCREFDGEPRVIVCDNDSSYPPLLDWLDYLERTPGECIEVVRFGENAGPRGPWRVPLGDVDHFVVTDPDLELDHVPLNVLHKLKHCLAVHPTILKAGLALRIDDLPDTPTGRHVREIESPYWNSAWPQPTGGCEWYAAPIDTTFAMERVGGPRPVYGPALRLAGPYQVRHLPWYREASELNEEERYYVSHSRNIGTYWTPRLKQELERHDAENNHQRD